MCGRYTLVTDHETMMKRFFINGVPIDLHPRYNIAPGQMIPSIIQDKGTRRIGQLRWGLVPAWTKDDKLGYKMMNAKAETIEEKPAFRNLFARKRCIIPADGFYEWKQTKHGKQPMRMTLKNQGLFAFAGLYDTWIRPDGEKIHSCTIITTEPNRIVADIHERMPVILRPEDEGIWLDREEYDPKLLRSLLVPYDANEMEAYPVSAKVGNVRYDQPECIAKITETHLN
ncbi:SOS response-associated peptidase [Brevibacillus ginsengisoli]|uniref:SOS response-associated peptidase n=1 Tax=Brevibacillus ginsengisoli TaxID=363854 RepID=UPI003CF81446